MTDSPPCEPEFESVFELGFFLAVSTRIMKRSVRPPRSITNRERRVAMIQMILTEEQQRLLTESHEPVEIVDRAGRRLTTVKQGWTDAEVIEVLTHSRASGEGGSHSDLVQRLKVKYPIPQ